MKKLVNGIILAGIGLMLTGFIQTPGKTITAPNLPHQKAAVSSASYTKPTEKPQPVSAPAVAVADTTTDTPTGQNTHVAQSSLTPYSGSHEDMMAAAGISPSDYGYAEKIVTMESSWNPYAQEPTTGACGLMQELPCGKSGCSLGDMICELRWGNQYVLSRYGSWATAYSFHLANNWY